MNEAWHYFKIGLFGGVGFICAYGLLKLILWLITMIASGAGKHDLLPQP